MAENRKEEVRRQRAKVGDARTRAPRNRLYLIFAFCLLIFSFFLPVFAGEHPPSDTERANPEAAVVQLLAIGPGSGDQNKECAATGILVNEDGVVLTNAHVVEDARRCLGGSPSAKIVAKFARPGERVATGISCDVLALDELHDLALLLTERPVSAERTDSCAWLDSREVAAATAVAVTGHSAFAWLPKTQKGTILRRMLLPLCDTSAEKSGVLILDIPLERGASGSPVYLDSGAVVGVVSRQNLLRPAETVAVPISYAIELLNKKGLRWHGSQ